MYYIHVYLLLLFSLVDDDDNISDTVSASVSLDSVSTLWSDTMSSSELTVIEGSMNDISSNASGSGWSHGVDDIDSGYVDSKSGAAANSGGRSRRRSVSRMRSVTTKNTRDPTIAARTGTASGNYWRPKSLFQTHKIKLQVYNYTILFSLFTYISFYFYTNVCFPLFFFSFNKLCISFRLMKATNPEQLKYHIPTYQLYHLTMLRYIWVYIYHFKMHICTCVYMHVFYVTCCTYIIVWTNISCV